MNATVLSHESPQNRIYLVRFNPPTIDFVPINGPPSPSCFFLKTVTTITVSGKKQKTHVTGVLLQKKENAVEIKDFSSPSMKGLFAKAKNYIRSHLL